jgi:hypothetical protein
MGNLASQQLTTQTDPDIIRRQILQDRERQLSGITNPQQQLAARLGGLLGGGAVNLAQGRGFFEVSDPLLTKVTQIQGVYNDVASRIDPAADPARFYSELQKAYGDAGLGREALAAANEAQKAKTTNMDFQLKETQLFEKNPELLAGRITSALEKGNEAEATRLANLNARLTEDREFNLEKRKVDLAKDRAYINYQNTLAEQGKFRVQPYNPALPELGFIRINERTGDVDYPPLPQNLLDKISTTSSSTSKDGKKDKPTQADADARIQKMRSGNTTTAAPAAAPVAAPVSPEPAAPVAAAPVDMSAFNPAAYNQNAGTYRLDADPIIKMISDYAGQNKELLQSNPEFRSSITAAYENRKQELARVMGTGVRFQ